MDAQHGKNATNNKINEVSHKAFYTNRPPLDPCFYKNNYNKYRRTRAILILCCLQTHKIFRDLERGQQMSILRRIERSCYNKTCDFIKDQGQSLNWDNPHFVDYYNITVYKIQKNLECINTQNTAIIDDLCAQDGIAPRIGFMSSRELQPEVSADLHNIIEKRMQQKIQKKISTQHHCANCGKWRTTEREIQARSLDEGSTLIITCETEGCSNRWTMSS